MHDPPRFLPLPVCEGLRLLVLCLGGGLVGWGSLGGVGGGLPVAKAQADTADEAPGLIERYRQARYRALARRHLQRHGRLPVYPPERLPLPTDSLRPPRSAQSSTADTAPSFPLRDVRRVRRLERDWFRTRFADTHWSFLGETGGYTFLDTTRTPALRARLQATFGAPTQTIADRPLKKPPRRTAQFEYWFVVNDSIPVQVTDPLGPKGRGLIVAAARPYRDRLRALRDTLLAPLRDARRAPYADYYYDEQRERWYRTGFDGQVLFLEQIPGPRVVPGQRAYLDPDRPSRSSASGADTP